MRTIGDRLALVLCCITLMIKESIDEKEVAGMLAAIVMSGMLVYFDNKKVKTVLLIIFALACLIWSEFLWMSPLAVYELCYQKWFHGLTMYIVLIVCFGRQQTVYVLLLFGLACFLAERTRRFNKREREFKNQQDAYLELKARGEHKQLELTRQQDGEIHLATLAERNRIAREIHDSVGHMLSRAILQVGALKAVNSQNALKAPLAALQDTLNTAMDNIRESVHDLKDEAFDLEDALNRIIFEYPGFSIYLDYDMSSQAPRSLKYCFAAIVKEALTNTAKHSNADRVRIVVREHPALYQLLVEDNGTNQKMVDKEGMGLENMKERADAFGGTFHINTEKGFQIFLSIPKKK